MIFFSSSCSIVCYKSHTADEINCTPKQMIENIVEDTNMSKTVFFQSEDTVDTEKLEELRKFLLKFCFKANYSFNKLNREQCRTQIHT